ncbi:MATE efflux family protein [Thozetella sp. PMI_491]|nr:MATE efflux family protein [Thozetella sp. PMI_491]
MDGRRQAVEDRGFSSAAPDTASEETPLLRSEGLGVIDDESGIGRAKDAWLLAKSALPLTIAGLLQQSLSLANVYSVGHLGKTELAAVSLSVMTANLTGYVVYQGMATALDTLCAQAYGSGRKQLVGLYFQQMALFLWLLTIPVGIIWCNAGRILGAIVPDRATADLAGEYMRVLLFGAPGYALFESGKRFVQSQGIFHATTYILLVIAPLHAFINWFLVFKLELGFIGAPMSVAITNNLLPFALFLYVCLIDGKQCWNGFTIRAFHNWGTMIQLAFPGFLMLAAEFLAFEILTLAASYFSTTQLAAASILSPLTALTFQIPFALAIASSTKIANLIGAGLPSQARNFAKVAAGGAFLAGVLDVFFILGLGEALIRGLTSDETVVEQVLKVLPVVAAFQLFDSLATTLNGTLRGLGKQSLGGIITMVCYYGIGMPTSFAGGFLLRWELIGLWTGIAIALSLNSLIVGAYLVFYPPWERAVLEARERDAKVVVDITH